MEQRPGTIDGFGGRVIVKAARAARRRRRRADVRAHHTGHGADEQTVGATAA